jgi:tetratricopeptide (TPR) repeat protein
MPFRNIMDVMAQTNSRTNTAFAIVILLLAATAAVSMYLNRDLPPIREAAGPSIPSNAQLPENHPPIDAANKVAALEQMSQNDPQNAQLKVQIGNAYYDSGQFQKAAEAYEQSLKLRPQDPGVETDLATCYHYLGQYDKALEILDKVLKYSPGFAQALFNKGIVLQSGKNDPKGAIAIWESLLQSNPNFPQRAELEQRINQLKMTLR